ncbi:hypothetical protein GCM10010363_52210 [Streptomyces omiyaensis]|nr:hypothetical protein GCM10010363_52210 [Streptomyces omiyaensis]
MLSHVRTYPVGRRMNEDARSVARSAPARQPFRRTRRRVPQRYDARAAAVVPCHPAVIFPRIPREEPGTIETPFVRLAPRLTEEAAP